MEHVPRTILTPPMVPCQGPDGEYLQIAVALAKCSCGKVHVAGAENDYGSPFNNAVFQLGVRFAQLNKWAPIHLDTIDESA